jgi:carbonic anhydrase
MHKVPACYSSSSDIGTRRNVLKSAMGFGALTGVSLSLPTASYAASLTKEARDKLTPDEVINYLKQGNDRFRTGRMLPHDYIAQKRATAGGQYPAAAILSCIDSRAPAEIIFDTEIGEAFNARIAGNIANDDLVGSLEFACALAGAKLVLVMGHTACGAVKGAIDSAELGNLTGLLTKIKPAVSATEFNGQRSSKNDAFVDAVAVTNVRRTVEEIRQKSPILSGLEKDGKIRLTGAMYYLVGGRVEFLV